MLHGVAQKKRAFTVVSTGKTGQADLGLASLNNFSGLWGVRALSSCLVPGPRVISTEELWPRV